MFGEETAVLLKMLAEDLRRYEQLRSMIQQGRDSDRYLHALNAGVDNTINLLNALPVKDERILAEMKNFKTALDTVTELYGRIPKSKLATLQLLNDQTVAESIRMANSFKDYSDQQEQNSIEIVKSSQSASPKGAARMQVETSGEILRSLSQLIRLNTQMLKLQSEQLAMQNKSGKDQVAAYQRFDESLSNGFQNFKLDSSLSTF